MSIDKLKSDIKLYSENPTSEVEKRLLYWMLPNVSSITIENIRCQRDKNNIELSKIKKFDFKLSFENSKKGWTEHTIKCLDKLQEEMRTKQ